MPQYLIRPGADSFGHAVGIILMDAPTPFIPGDVGNASTYKYPVLYKTAPGVTVERLLINFDPNLTQVVVETAKYLESMGVRFITSNCGFMVNFQDVVAEAVSVPVALSSLLQLPFIERALGRDKKIGLITGNGSKLDERVLRLTGIKDPERVVIRGMENVEVFSRPVLEGDPLLDSDLIEAEVIKAAKEMVAKNPEIGAMLIGCSNLPPYALAVQKATNLPVFDFISMIDYFQAASFRQRVEGFY